MDTMFILVSGHAADFIIIDDAGKLKATYLDGVKRFEAEEK